MSDFRHLECAAGTALPGQALISAAKGVQAVLIYALITLCLALTGVAGFQLAYMFYLDRLDRERKARLHELEIRCRNLSERLAEAESQIEGQGELIEALYADLEDAETWAEILDEN